MKSTKFHSMVRRVVIFPMTVMAVILLITIAASLLGFLNMQQQVADGYVSAAEIALNRLEVWLDQLENDFAEYISYNPNHARLRALSRDTPSEEYQVYLGGTSNWMDQTRSSYSEMEGLFIYYGNLERLMFRGSTNVPIHNFIRGWLDQEHDGDRYRMIVAVNGNSHLVVAKKYAGVCFGAWIPISKLEFSLGLEGGSYPGSIYFRDEAGNNTLPDPEQNMAVRERSADSPYLMLGRDLYYNRLAHPADSGLSIGILMLQQNLWAQIPLLTKIILILAVCAMVLIPLSTLWLRRKIAQPVKALTTGMERVGAGEIDYRITLPPKRSIDEFDELKYHFNLMADQLNELEYKLYVSKIREQETELKYISQQIRPHFILNALNIIYTYEESEFPLVKKMVLYLSEYFRYIVNLKVDFVALQQEMQHIENYLNIQKERYLDQFDFSVEWEEQTGQTLIPPLLLQTFVENCMKYGMKTEGTTFVSIRAGGEGERLKITIGDNGNGFPGAVLEQLNKFVATREPQDGMGIGIQNAVERLDILYQSQTTVKFYNKASGGAAVDILLPLHGPEPREE